MSVIEEFVENARQVTIADAVLRLGVALRGAGAERIGPCPCCGGRDRFSVNLAKNVWNCRGQAGGHDAIGLAGHVLGYSSLSDRAQFLAACSAVLGVDVPEGGEREPPEARQARETRLAEQRAEGEARNRERDEVENRWRQQEINRARGIYEAAGPVAGTDGETYLSRRCGGAVAGKLPWARFAALQTYWHGTDDAGRPASIHTGRALVLPIMDAAMSVQGCHITWLDLGAPPKLRPAILDHHSGEALPTKKMRGAKKGGLLPLCGDPAAKRWVGGEGIENTLAIAVAEEFAGGTFYFAAGDLGNLSGPAARKGRLRHPTLRTEGNRPVMVPSPHIDPQRVDEGFWLASHVEELALIGDGDSEPFATASAMLRARERALQINPWCLVSVVMPPDGADFSDIMTR